MALFGVIWKSYYLERLLVLLSYRQQYTMTVYYNEVEVRVSTNVLGPNEIRHKDSLWHLISEFYAVKA